MSPPVPPAGEGLWVVLLRGVNVGGHHRVAMGELRSWLTDAGFDEVRSYIQSGNLVMRGGVAVNGAAGPPAREAQVAGQVRAVLARYAELDVPVMVRSAADFVSAIEANPFIAEGAEPDHCHLAFGDGAATIPARPDDDTRDRAVAIGRELYLHLPEGMGRSRLGALVARSSDPAYTTRNWRTVTRLAEMTTE